MTGLFVNQYNKMKSQRDEARYRVKELELEVARLDAGWEKSNGRVHEVSLERTHLQSLLTPRRIDEDTPDGVLVWAYNAWREAHRGDTGSWVDSCTSIYLGRPPERWLPMLPAPEEDA